MYEEVIASMLDEDWLREDLYVDLTYVRGGHSLTAVLWLTRNLDGSLLFDWLRWKAWELRPGRVATARLSEATLRQWLAIL